MMRSIRAAAAAAFLAALATLASAVPIPAPTELPVPNTTPGSACGAQATGAVVVEWAGPRPGRIELVTGSRAGEHVNADGYWAVCVPAPVAHPKDCPPEDQYVRSWRDGQHRCSADNGERDRLIPATREATWRQTAGPMRGQLTEACVAGKRQAVTVTCAPATHCDSAWWTDYRRARYSVAAGSPASWVPNGAYTRATGPEGASVRVQCVKGSFQLAAQCEAQDVVRVIGKGPKQQRIVYRYEGPAVDFNARVRAFSPDGASIPLTCGAEGYLWG